MSRRVKMASGGGGMELDPSILEFFDSITGSGAVNLHIVYPKAQDLRHSGTEFLQLLLRLVECPALQRARPAVAEELKALVTRFNDEFDANFCTPADVSSAMFDNTPATKDFRVDYGVLYRKTKECEIISTLLLMTSEMVQLRKEFERAPKTSLAKLVAAARANPESDFADMFPFAVGKLDHVKNEVTSLVTLCDRDPADAEEIWKILRRVLSLGLRAYGVLEKPDFDSDAIAEAVSSSLSNCAKSVRGADAGFALIRNSTDLFKKNSSRYQREIEATNNPMTLFSSYCRDLEEHAQQEMKSGDKRARKTKMDMMRIMSYITTTTQKMQSCMGAQTAGARLLGAISKHIGEAGDKMRAEVESEISAEAGAASEQAVRDFRDKIRGQSEEDAKKTTEEAAKMMASRPDAVVLVGGSAGNSDPPASRPWNLEEALAYIEGTGPPPGTDAEKAERKREKRARQKAAKNKSE